ncbi:MAG: T9SS type A sorting domain-containing protein [Prolixibacteraceae bacterium]|nr:T9SS type A sorting domain-containing protein [Prolixibacteraceae bacterium]
MKYYNKNILLIILISITSLKVFSQGVIVDHTSTDITKIPIEYIQQAKESLHIGYGHTSHGSQLTTGMTGLVAFANNGGLELSLPNNIFQWNNGGTGGALDLEEGSGYDAGWLELDCGNYPLWVNETREYLNNPSHSDVNVIIWSWCGQLTDRTGQEVTDMYLNPMVQLESEYPDVKFVYMTGHADGSGEQGNLHLRNQQIRDFCMENNKILYDFYDIECYDPDGNYFGDKWVNDECHYYAENEGNWAVEWQNSHTEGVDWYNCESAHSQPLNANRKAYAAWWLWARLTGWDPVSGNSGIQQPEFKLRNFPNPFSVKTTISFNVVEKSNLSIDVYSASGEFISKLSEKEYASGNYSVKFENKNLPPGVYLCRLKTGDKIQYIKMLKFE